MTGKEAIRIAMRECGISDEEIVAYETQSFASEPALNMDIESRLNRELTGDPRYIIEAMKQVLKGPQDIQKDYARRCREDFTKRSTNN